MFYRFLKIIVGIAVKFYFRKITVKNIDLIPDDTPIIFAPNHPGAFMDPIVIASVLKQHLHFLARGESFSNSVSRWIFGNMNMIPIYRSSQSPELMFKNKDVFNKAFDLLESKGSIIIFPEGISKTERRIRKIKTGAARIAMGAEERLNFTLGVKIIPIGLNYSNLHRFQSDVFINVANPISVSDYMNEYNENEFETINKITDLIHDKLQAHTIVVSEELDLLLEQIEVIYKFDLKRESNFEKHDKEGDFKVSKDISEAITYYHNNEPLRLSRIRQKIEDYNFRLNRLDLKDHTLVRNNVDGGLVKNIVKTITLSLIGFPVFIYGFINNFLPYRIPRIFAEKSRPDFYAAVSLSVGIVAFSLFYSFQILVFDYFVNNPYSESWLTFVYGISLPVSGMFSIIYWRILLKNRERWHFVSSFYKKTNLVAGLVSMREDIINELNQAKIDFRNK